MACGRGLVGVAWWAAFARCGPPGGRLGAVGGLPWALPGRFWLVALVGLAWSLGVCTPVLLCGGTEFTWSSLFLVELGAAAAWSRRCAALAPRQLVAEWSPVETWAAPPAHLAPQRVAPAPLTLPLPVVCPSSSPVPDPPP